MEDIGEKQPISAYKVAESMFFFSYIFFSCPAAAEKQFRQAEAPHAEEIWFSCPSISLKAAEDCNSLMERHSVMWCALHSCLFEV